MRRELVQLKNLKKYFPIKVPFRGKIGEIHAVDDVSFEIEEGEIFGLAGESGCGKSTIAKLLVGLYTPTEGTILYKGRDLSNHNFIESKWFKQDVQLIFQNPGGSLNPRKKVAQILAAPLKIHNLANGKERTKQIRTMLERVRIPSEFMYRYPSSLSGGQKQRVAIARALLLHPSFLILDEPTSALDVSVQAKVISLLLELKRDMNLTYLFISHDLSLMRNITSTIAIIYLGQILEIADSATLFSHPVHPYTQTLLASIPVISSEEEAIKPKIQQVKGSPPSPADIPTGCRFHPRCPIAREICIREVPQLTVIGQSHRVRCHLYNETV